MIQRNFWRNVLPSVIAFAFSGVYSIVDGMFVGQGVGDAGLAAINVAWPVTALVQALGTGLGMAAAVVLSVCIGRRDAAEERRALGCTAVLLLLAGVLSTALLALLYRPLLPLLGAEGSVLAYADSYTRVIVLGSLFQVLGTGLVPLLRTYDGADAAMCSMTAGFLTNVVLDALFISVFQWGTAGAAAATVIAQGVSAALGLAYLFPVKRVFRGVSFRLNRRTVLRLLATSLSPFGLTMLNTVTLVVINRGALAYGGSLAVACYAVMSYAICMVHFIIQGIGDGAQPLLSRYYGAGEREALAQVRTLTFRAAPAAALLCGIALFLGRSAIPHLFGASNAATRLFQVILPLFLLYLPFMSVVRILTSYFCATEQITRADLLIYGQPVVLVVLSLILPRAGLGLSGVWLSVPLTQILLAGAGVLLLRTAHPGAKPAPAAAPQPAVPSVSLSV